MFTVTGETPPSGFSKAKLALTATMAKGAASVAPAAHQRRKPEEEPAAPAPTWRLHDFRRTTVTWLAGAGFAPHVADRLLNHVTGAIQGVAAVYQRHDFALERKAALDAWGKHVLACAGGGDTAGNVVPLRTRKRSTAAKVPG